MVVNPLYLPVSIFSAVITYIMILLFQFFSKEKIRFYKFPYSDRNYHIYMIALLLPIFIICLSEHSMLQFYIFVTLSLLGIVVEIIFSILWKFFFRRPFWHYPVHPLFGGYSSLLNFVPWGMGGALSMHVFQQSQFFLFTDLVEIKVEDMINFWIICSVLFLFIALARIIISGSCSSYLRNKAKFKPATYLLFILPFLVATPIFSYIFGIEFLLVGLIGGMILFISEYAFGKSCVFLVSKRLWVYNYYSYDNGHITPLAFIPFVMAFYFYLLVYLVLKDLPF